MTSKLNSQVDYKIDLSSIQPFTPQTEKILIDNIFFPLQADTTGKKLQGACKTWQSLAQEVSELRNLEKNYKRGKIDLGWKDRGAALALCIGTALLVATAVATCFLTVSPFLIPKILGLLSVHAFAPLAILAFGISCATAIKTFNHPPPQKLAEKLKQLAHITPSQADLDELLSVLKKLESLKLEKQKTELTGMGLSDLARKLEEQDRLSMAAFEVSEMLYILNPHQKPCNKNEIRV